MTSASTSPVKGPERQETNRASRKLPNAGRGSGPPWGAIGMPAEKSMDFGPSVRRLLGRLVPERLGIAIVVVLGVVSVTLAVIGPMVLGYATDVIFAGVIGSQLPPGASVEEAASAARAQGNETLANVIIGSGVVPGQGIDFVLLGWVLLGVVAIYLATALFGWMQSWLLNGLVQRTIFTLRKDVEEKIHRLPLRFFDRQPRGEVLSRVTNDIDNLSQSLQQTMSQLLTSLLTIVGVVAMMLVISPLLAVVALVSIPASLLVTRAIAKRSQRQFVAQWKHTGALNAHIEEAFTGHELVTVFGRQREVEKVFAERNENLYRASFGAQFVSGLIMPAMMFLGNLNYVVVAVVGGIRVATGALSLGDVQAFI